MTKEKTEYSYTYVRAGPPKKQIKLLEVECRQPLLQIRTRKAGGTDRGTAVLVHMQVQTV